MVNFVYLLYTCHGISAYKFSQPRARGEAQDLSAQLHAPLVVIILSIVVHQPHHRNSLSLVIFGAAVGMSILFLNRFTMLPSARLVDGLLNSLLSKRMI